VAGSVAHFFVMIVAASQLQKAKHKAQRIKFEKKMGLKWPHFLWYAGLPLLEALLCK
jgi:hypothetical protein